MKIIAIILGDQHNLKQKAENLSGFCEVSGIEEILECLIISEDPIAEDVLPCPINTHKLNIWEWNDVIEIKQGIDILKANFGNIDDTVFIFDGSDLSVYCANLYAVSLGIPIYSQIKKIEKHDHVIDIFKPTYGANLIDVIREKTPVVICADKSYNRESKLMPYSEKRNDYFKRSSHVVSRKKYLSHKGENCLNKAKKVVVVGGGVSKSDMPIVYEFATMIKAELAGTRSAAEKGCIELERMIGISGKSIAPEVCIVLGVSGMAAFMNGIEKSKKIIAVNNDKNAPIFRQADIGIVEDYQYVLRKLMEKLNEPN